MSINSKKDNLRFSLRMNSCDPMQVEAARILNTKGHRISDFVARAVITFVNSNAPENANVHVKSNESLLRKEGDKVELKQDSNVQKSSDSMHAMLNGLGDLKRI